MLPRLLTSARAAGAAFALSALIACEPAGVEPVVVDLVFSVGAVELGPDFRARVTLVNRGAAVGPVELANDPVRFAGASVVPGMALTVSPATVPTLARGASAEVEIALAPGPTPLGEFRTEVLARAEGEVRGRVAVRFLVEPADTVDAASVRVAGPEGDALRRGDVVALGLEVRDAEGRVLNGAPARWRVLTSDGGLVVDGRLVAYRTGTLEVEARVGQVADTLSLTVAPRGGSVSLMRRGGGLETLRHTSDLWIHGGFAYTGTWGSRQTDGATAFGNALFAWRLDGAQAVRTDSVVVDARTVNDVKVRADGRLAVLTHEGSNDGLNGVTLLDLTDPGHPRAVGRTTTGLESGVHNAWLEGDYLYLVLDGVGNGLRVLDVSDPAAPVPVASYYAGSSFLHDVLVRDGLAFLSHWDAGLVVLDVGAGVAGGSPTAPVELGRVQTAGGQTHNAWYWPAAGYAFVGEEDFATPGILHVVDVRDPRAPREVATFSVAGQPPHNFWLDEARGVLYMAWYGNGVRALDVTGELMGELDRQGRELGFARYDGGSTRTWAPQLADGLVWVSDMNGGLIALEPVF